MRTVLPFALVLAAIGACTFPDADYSDGGGAAGDGSGGSSGSSSGSDSGNSSGSSGTDASSGSSSGTDGSSGSPGDASRDRTAADAPADVAMSDVTSSSSSGGDGSVNCDVDNDTFKGPQCGGNDCCDTDPNAHPNQMQFFTFQDGCHSWDYNCDGTTEYEFPQNIPCTGTPTLGCNGGPGFLGTEDCGQNGPYGSCQANGALACALKQTGTDTQGCQ